jgi:hypothetical protein
MTVVDFLFPIRNDDDDAQIFIGKLYCAEPL